MQRREKLFATNDQRRFRTYKGGGRSLCKLKIDEKVISDPGALLDVCAGHFEELSKSRCDSGPVWKELNHQIDCLSSKSLQNEEHILDVLSQQRRLNP